MKPCCNNRNNRYQPKFDLKVNYKMDFVNEFIVYSRVFFSIEEFFCTEFSSEDCILQFVIEC